MKQLKTYTFNGAYNVNYAQNGNINSKSDAGTYIYDSPKLNAVTGISGNPGTIPTSTNQSITYTPFNMAKSITEGDNNLELVYGPDNQRIRSVLRHNGAEVKKKYYSAGYEKEITATTDRDLHYIYCPYGLVAIIIRQGSTDSTFYTETDHLGSITGLLREDGTYKERFSFDACLPAGASAKAGGRRRNPADWTYNNIPVSTITDRGYTGHEHLDIFGLINMNGRMYDPVLGRFAGVDPIIQSLDNSLSFDGYSYCLNNPLKYSDPTGFAYYYDPWSQQDGKFHPFAELQAEQYGGIWNDIPLSLSDTFGGAMYREQQKDLNNDDTPIVQYVLLQSINGKYEFSGKKYNVFKIPVTKQWDNSQSFPLNYYNKISGLTVNDYTNFNSTDYRDVKIDISFTSQELDNSNFHQMLRLAPYFKKPGIQEDGSPFYYNEDQRKALTTDNTIIFRDTPNQFPGRFDATTTLINHNGEIILQFSWGYYKNPQTKRITLFPIIILYPIN